MERFRAPMIQDTGVSFAGKTQMLPAGCEPLNSQADSGQILLPERAEQLYRHTVNIQLKIKHVDFIIVQVHGWLAGKGKWTGGMGKPNL